MGIWREGFEFLPELFTYAKIPWGYESNSDMINQVSDIQPCQRALGNGSRVMAH